MKAVLLVMLIFVAVGMIATILMQRSEGGALGMGGGGPGGLMSGRAAGNVLTRTTSILGAAFFLLCIALAALSGTGQEDGSVVTRVEGEVDPLAAPPVPPEPRIPLEE
ncbi:MAG: preprotein translocase subunit SecG [Caulobacterales bacterium]|nr:preprotein translocase subunit SecG [Caulobacterales bacterium]